MEDKHSYGTLYGIGVGPGDPELMTLKALRLIRELPVIAVPGECAEEATAYQIAVQAAPELRHKQLLPIPVPMRLKREALQEAHRRGAEQLEEVLRQGQSVGMLCLGDPTIYASFSYLEALVRADGFATEYVSGVPSFCAAAAALGEPLARWNEPLHIVPALHFLRREGNSGEDGNSLQNSVAAQQSERENAAGLPGDGTLVLMKSGRSLLAMKEQLAGSGRSLMMVENCGLPGEKRYRSAEELPEQAGYFSIVIARIGDAT